MLCIWRSWPYSPSHYSLLLMKTSVVHPGQHPHWGTNISEEQVCSVCTSNHNTVKYTASKPKGREKCVTHDYIICSPDTVFLVLFFLSQSLSLSFSLFLFLVHLSGNASSFVLRDWGGRCRQVGTALGKRENPVTAGVSLSHNEQTWQDESV